MALSSNALTTIATLCAELGIDVPASGSATETKLERFIGEASDAIEAYCDRKLSKETVTERVKGFGSHVLRLSRYPLVSITSVHYDGTEVDSTYWDATPQEEDARQGQLRHLTGEWEWTADYQQGASPERRAGTERPLYSVVYVGGYVLPKDATGGNPRTLPYDLERAAILTCVSLYRNEGRNQDIVSESVMSASRTYADRTSTDSAGGIIPNNALALLEKHRRWS